MKTLSGNEKPQSSNQVSSPPKQWAWFQAQMNKHNATEIAIPPEASWGSAKHDIRMRKKKERVKEGETSSPFFLL